MVWDRTKSYTYQDYESWKREGYRGMELIAGVPYQYGVSVFEEPPVKYPPETLQRLLHNIHGELAHSLAGTPYKAFLFCPIALGGKRITPDLIVMDQRNQVVLLAEIAASEKHMRLQQCREAGIPAYWVIFPDMRCFSVYFLDGEELDGEVYESGNLIPIAATGLTFCLGDVWEPPVL